MGDTTSKTEQNFTNTIDRETNEPRTVDWPVRYNVTVVFTFQNISFCKLFLHVYVTFIYSEFNHPIYVIQIFVMSVV